MRLIYGPARWLSQFALFHSLRVRLTLLVLLASLPALLLLLYTANQQREDALASGQENASRLVRLAAADQRRIFDQAEQLLTTIALLPEVRGNDPDQCSQIMSEVLETNNEFENLGVINLGGSIFCSAVKSDQNVVLNPQFIDNAFAANDFVIGTYQQGPFSDEPIVTYAAPVPNPEGDPQRLVYASLDLSSLDTFANLADLPEGAVFSVYDRDGTLLLRSPSDESAIGKSFAGKPVVERMIDDKSGVALQQLDDPESIYAGEWIRIRSGDSDASTPGAAFITVSLPKDEVVARADEVFEDNLSRLGLAALVAVALAWIGADLFMARDGESRKALVAGIYRVFETGDLAQLDDVFAVDVVDRSPAQGQAAGLSGYKQLVAQFRSAFPNGAIEPYELLADNDKVVARVRLRGRHVGDFFGSPPSGENVVANGIETFRFANGVVVEMWSMFGPLLTVEPRKPEVAEEASSETRRRPWWRRLLRRGRS